MTHINKDVRASVILRVMDEVENSSLSINQYFKEKEAPFGRAQYFLYKKALREKGAKGLHDQRGEGNNLKFTNEVKNFVKGLLDYNQSITSSEVKNAIKNEFGIAISNTVINDFRRENDLSRIRPESSRKSLDESGASEIAIALALDTGLIDAIVDSICLCVQKKRESRFKPLEEKVGDKRFASMGIFNLSRESIVRYTLALFSLPLVTANGRVRSIDNPRGNALKYLCGFNYKASTVDIWIDFWSRRNKSDTIFACYYIDGNTKALWSSKSCHKGKVTMLGRVMNCLEQVFIHDGQGHPIYVQTFNGHADLGKNALRMMDTISEYLKNILIGGPCRNWISKI